MYDEYCIKAMEEWSMPVYWSSWIFGGVWHVSRTHEKSNLCLGYPLSPPYPWFLCAWSRGNMFFFSNIYSPIDLQGKLLVWNNIHLVRSLFSYLPWIIAGDFNAILDLTEK